MKSALLDALDRDEVSNTRRSVEEPFTCSGAAETGNAVRASNLTLEFVVVCEFLIYRG
jgi:hypothetical protein